MINEIFENKNDLKVITMMERGHRRKYTPF